MHAICFILSFEMCTYHSITVGFVVANFVNEQAHYVGKLESGKIFDSSYNRGKPLTFRIGVGEVSTSLCLLIADLLGGARLNWYPYLVGYSELGDIPTCLKNFKFGR